MHESFTIMLSANIFPRFVITDTEQEGISTNRCIICPALSHKYCMLITIRLDKISLP